MKTKLLSCVFTIMLIQLPFSVIAAEGEDIFVGGLELDKVLNLASAMLASVLFVLTVFAYNRKKNKRLLYVSFAFLLFAIKGFIFSSEILFGDSGWIDPVANLLDFAILLSFFFGIMKK